MSEFWRRLLFLFRRRRFECDLEEEMRFHLEMKARETGAAAARRQFGNITLLREDSRAAWGWAWLETLARDLRYGMRLYRRSPGFTAVAVLTLGLGLGVNIAIFMLLYNVILRPLPYPHADRLVKVYVTFLSDQRGARDIGFSYPKFQDLRRLSSSFQSLAAYGRGNFDLADHPAERVRGEFVSSAYFRTLAVPAALGRTFLPQEDAVLRAGAVAVIADSLWKRRFGADPAVLGKKIRVETISVRIVGVAPPGFTGETGRAELWLPITMAPLAGKSDSALTFRAEHWHMVVGRLKRGVTRAQAASEVAAVMQRVEQTSPTPGWRRTAFGTDLVPLAESRLEPSERRAIFVLYGAVGFVLLIACGNLTNLTRARMVGRQRETAMRLALGAGRGSLLRQFLAENLLLSLAGGAAGVLLASWTSRLLIYLRPADYASLPSYFRTLDPDSLRLTVPVLAFSLALSLASGLLFGLMPALRAARGDVYTTLKQGSTGRRAGRGPGFRSVLLPAQMALAVVLLSGGVLMMRSFARLVNDPMGAEVHRVLAFEVSLPDYRYPNRQSRRAFLDRAAARLRELPAVESVALSDDVPALERDTVTDIAVANRPGSDFIGKLSSLWWFAKALCYALSDWQPAFPRRWLPRARWAACCMELTPAIP